MTKRHYCAPQSCWSIVSSRDLLCDSYNSGIDDYDYENVDWTTKP